MSALAGAFILVIGVPALTALILTSDRWLPRSRPLAYAVLITWFAAEVAAVIIGLSLVSM